MKILLVMPYFKMYRMVLPPLGLGYIAAALEKKGYLVDIKDYQAEQTPVDRAVKDIVDAGYDAVGISAITDNRFNAIELIRQIKRRNKNIFTFAGGPHFSATALDALDKIQELSTVVRGEGEETTCELIDAYSQGKGFESVLGITYRDCNGKIIENPFRPPIGNIDLLRPAWHKFNLRKYNHSQDDPAAPLVGVISSRGCAYNCAFCANTASRLRFRNPKNFVDEIAFLKDTYGYQKFIFLDTTFTVSHRRILEICNLLIERKLGIQWAAGARVDTVNREILTLMKEAGCFRIGYGIESGSEKILKIISKGISISKIKEAVKLTVDLGLKVHAFFMVSFPDEGVPELKETIRLIKDFNSYEGCKPIYGFTVIYPGTELEAIAKKRNLLSNDFSWNTYRIFPKYFLTDTPKTVPYYEEKLAIETIKWQIIISNYDISWYSLKIIFTKCMYHAKKILYRTFLQKT